MNEYILLNDDCNSFESIKNLVKNDLLLHKFIFSNGIRIHARMKITTRSGLINTQYCHIVIIKSNGNWEYFREKNDSSYKLINSGKQNFEDFGYEM